VAQGCSANVLDVPLPRIEPFKISIDEAVLLDLRDRIRRTRWPDQVEGAGWSYGTDGRYLRELLSTWAEDFDWRVQERQLNGFAHYRVQIDGLGVHFVHERGEGPDPLPIVLTHGWPSTFVEHLALVPLLTDPLGHGGRAEDAFDVVVTSMPGFGFSDRPTVSGVFESTIADTWCRLMRDGLGYERFGAHGSDVGSGVTIELARRHPDRLLGIHLSAFYLETPPPPWPPAIREFFAAREHERADEGAYSRMQATKPQSLAYGLTDSPAGLAGWIIEHFRGRSDCGGDVETRFTRDQLLTILTIYWATETINSSMRVGYYEYAHHAAPPAAGSRIQVPAGFAVFADDFRPGSARPPRELAEHSFANITRWSRMPRGGHFAALEEPELLADEIRAFFRPLRQSSGRRRT
jgi:pimeloyl-ACP methyl ester carboxylesterase